MAKRGLLCSAASSCCRLLSSFALAESDCFSVPAPAAYDSLSVHASLCTCAHMSVLLSIRVCVFASVCSAHTGVCVGFVEASWAGWFVDG